MSKLDKGFYYRVGSRKNDNDEVELVIKGEIIEDQEYTFIVNTEKDAKKLASRWFK